MFTRNSLMSSVYYRIHYLFMILSNAVYVVITYFLWKSIYTNSASIGGMSFEQAFTYLALAMSIFILFQSWTEWDVSRRILSGDIVMDFVRPVDFQLKQLFDVLGSVASNFIAITVPTLLIITLAFGAPIPLGPNVPIFALSLVLAFLISYFFDYLVGVMGFYTESIWGISMTKEVIVLSLSGAMVPIGFFPEGFQRVLEWLPFQAIYNLPLKALLDGSPTLGGAAALIGTQVAWAIVLLALSRLFFRRASRVLTVNGG
jgi:ABC-2 type transport system permease protein